MRLNTNHTVSSKKYIRMLAMLLHCTIVQQGNSFCNLYYSCCEWGSVMRLRLWEETVFSSAQVGEVFPGGTSGWNLPANTGDIRDTGTVPGSGRSPGGGHGNPAQYFCLENPIDREAWRTIVHRVAKSQTWLKWRITHPSPNLPPP